MSLTATLLECRQLAGGWFMVVMEYLDPSDGWVALIDHQHPPSPEMVAAMQATLDLAHQHGFVHGDFRDRNIFLRRWGAMRLCSCWVRRHCKGRAGCC